MIKSILKITVFFSLSFLSGMFFYRNNWFPRPQLQAMKDYFDPPVKMDNFAKYKDKLVASYSNGVPLFSDRTYYDTIGQNKLENTFVVQIPRHYKDKIILNIKDSVVIYRFISKPEFFKNWTMMDIKVFVQGKSCTHQMVAFNSFGPGIIELKNPNPISATPILIKFKNDRNRSILNSIEILNPFNTD